MAEITAALVKELRDKSGAGMMDCKKALTATGGDLELAMDELRKQGLASAQKKSSRATKDGAVDSYIHAGGKIGVLVEVGVETDFVTRSDQFKEFTHDLAMHVAAAAPVAKSADVEPPVTKVEPKVEAKPEAAEKPAPKVEAKPAPKPAPKVEAKPAPKVEAAEKPAVKKAADKPAAKTAEPKAAEKPAAKTAEPKAAEKPADKPAE